MWNTQRVYRLCFLVVAVLKADCLVPDQSCNITAVMEQTYPVVPSKCAASTHVVVPDPVDYDCGCRPCSNASVSGGLTLPASVPAYPKEAFWAKDSFTCTGSLFRGSGMMVSRDRVFSQWSLLTRAAVYTVDMVINSVGYGYTMCCMYFSIVGEYFNIQNIPGHRRDHANTTVTCGGWNTRDNALPQNAPMCMYAVVYDNSMLDYRAYGGTCPDNGVPSEANLLPGTANSGTAFTQLSVTQMEQVRAGGHLQFIFGDNYDGDRNSISMTKVTTQLFNGITRVVPPQPSPAQPIQPPPTCLDRVQNTSQNALRVTPDGFTVTLDACIENEGWTTTFGTSPFVIVDGTWTMNGGVYTAGINTAAATAAGTFTFKTVVVDREGRTVHTILWTVYVMYDNTFVVREGTSVESQTVTFGPVNVVVPVTGSLELFDTRTGGLLTSVPLNRMVDVVVVPDQINAVAEGLINVSSNDALLTPPPLGTSVAAPSGGGTGIKFPFKFTTPGYNLLTVWSVIKCPTCNLTSTSVGRHTLNNDDTERGVYAVSSQRQVLVEGRSESPFVLPAIIGGCVVLAAAVGLVVLSVKNLRRSKYILGVYT